MEFHDHSSLCLKTKIQIILINLLELKIQYNDLRHIKTPLFMHNCKKHEKVPVDTIPKTFPKNVS